LRLLLKVAIERALTHAGEMCGLCAAPGLRGIAADLLAQGT